MADGLYLYCVVPNAHAPPGGLRGVDGLPVELVDLLCVGLWVSRLAAPPQPALETVQQHNTVVEAAMRDDITPIPLRFGQYIEPADSLAGKVQGRTKQWAALLAAFHGCAEYGVRVIDLQRNAPARDVRQPAGTSGRAYLADLARNAKLAESRLMQAERVAAALRARADGLIVRERIEPFPTARGVASIAHLVRRCDEAAYRDAIEAAGTSMPALRFMTTGPWAPYSFAE